MSLASILCENLDEAHMVQPDVFIGADPYLNSPVTCDVFPRVNIELWKTDSPALQVISGTSLLFKELNFVLRFPKQS